MPTPQVPEARTECCAAEPEQQRIQRQKNFPANARCARCGHANATEYRYRLAQGGGVFREDMMALHTTAARQARLVDYNKNTCPQCGEWLLAPTWSEHFSERCVRHTWSCDLCSYTFETTVFFPPLEKAAA